MPKNRRWPENCVWPEPAWNGGGIWWEEDEVDPMLLDEDGQELLVYSWALKAPVR